MENTTKPQLRSTSVPSRLSPSCSQIEMNHNKLRTLQPIYSSTSIHNRIACLIDLYIWINEVTNASQIQQVKLQCGNRSLIEDALVGSIKLLDSHSELVELLAQMKDHVRTLQFSLRRKGVTRETHILDYILSQKKLKKNIMECIRSLDKMERGIDQSCLVDNEDCYFSMMIRFLRDIAIATISVFRAIFVFMLGKSKVEKRSSLVAKFMPTGRVSCEQNQEIVSDVNIIDITLCSLKTNLKKNENKTDYVQIVTESLQNLDVQIEGYEVGMDHVYRKLIQTRVSLLNILAN
ncbi:uncharacterized protein [Rutidosis leptorrhynchoides]|uniref:uncharacterized protein n=1 Tax=Rutidosis leptorrhynchoides TaxID=125765 RepID=UPI003A9A530B